ncbi:MAG: M23 family metallopeptidase, partial [Chloroflexi bacterium]|nr:M23 family metallopeptidase [Chloroflexota bacterium]
KMLVRKGESVGPGQRIGSVGSTGNSTGPHLHFEIRWHNTQRNPLGFLH